MLTELKKPECNVFHSNDYAETDITNVSIQSFLKCLITEISENEEDLLMLLLDNADHNSKPVYFKSKKKWNKVVVHDIFHHKKILGSIIYAKPLLLHTFTGCDTTSPIKRIWWKCRQRYQFQGQHRPFFQFATPKSNLFRK